MEEQSRSTNTQLDKAFVSIQTKLIDTVGPLGNLWMLFQDIRSKIDKGCDDPSAQAHVDNVDFRHILDLLEKTISTFVNPSKIQRRLDHFLETNRSVSRKNDKHLFGSEFKEELKEWTKTKKEASEMALALGGKKKSHKKKVINYDTPRQVQQSQRWEQKESHQDKPPFQSRPPSHLQGARNSGGRDNFRGNGFHRGNKRGGTRYVKFCFKSLSHKKYRQNKQYFNLIGESKPSDTFKTHSYSRKVKTFCKELGKNHLRQKDTKRYPKCRGKFSVTSDTTERSKNDCTQSKRKTPDVNRGQRNLDKRSHCTSKTMQGSIPKQLVLSTQKKNGGQRPVLNLKQLNQHVMYQHVKMEGLFMIKDLLTVSDFMLKIDLKEAFSVLSISQNHRKFLRFKWEGTLFEYTALPFGLAEGPRLFTKITKDGCSYDHISRRHTPHGKKPPKTGNSQKFNIISSPKIKISDQLEKIKLKSNSKDKVSRFSDKFSRNDVLSTNRKGISDKNKMQRNVKCRHCDSKAISTVDRKAVNLYASIISSKFAKSFSSNGSNKGSVEGKVLRTKKNSLTNSKSMENFRGRSTTEGLSKAAAELHEKAWRPGTQLSYKSSWGKWVSWCSEQSVNPFQAPLATVIEFLKKLFKDGLQYRTISTYISAISKNHPLIDSLQVGKHPLIIRHMRAIFNERTPASKYEFSWDADIVLNEILSWGSNQASDIKHLSWKLVMLLALSSAGIASEIGMLNCKYMKQQGSQILFDLPKLTKTCRPGSKTKSIAFNSFPNEKSLCVVTCINDYMSRTQSWREQGDNIDRSWLLLSVVKLHHHIVPSSVARWLKEKIKKSGFSSLFTGHSTCSASTSKAKRVLLSTQDVIDQVKWTNESTLMRFYCKPIISNTY
ncbi:unnamed protein product [Mytilus coruscus]|uniref:Core-binding (CB) domain-containing protein n=1 Tax=Mytilus coruscus TaxID=42192 RepID=A0A6J8D9P9_MYTCO|nr:unnamed protein product [Mytilus coruscus]